MNSIELDRVSVAFGRQLGVKQITTSLEAGEITAVLGGNGAGKTVLLKLLATLIAPTTGTITYDGVRRRTVSAQGTQLIGWVGHQPGLYDRLTARQNLAFFGTAYGLENPEKTAGGWLQRVGLSAVADREVGAFSRGMKQRLAVARALVHQPELLLLDEPWTGIDASGRRDVADILNQYSNRQRIIVIATHREEPTRRIVDTIVRMRGGTITRRQSVSGSSDKEWL